MKDQAAPFLATLATPLRPLSAALPAQPTAPATSPWTPKGAADSAAGAERAELERARATAIEAGRAQGLAETAALRERLARLADEVALARAGRIASAAEAIADAATAVVEAWLGRADRCALFAPVIQGWLARAGDGPGAVAYAHPGEVAALRAAIGDAKLDVAADPELATGDVRVRSDVFDVTHEWSARLRELRDAIATALERAEAP